MNPLRNLSYHQLALLLWLAYFLLIILDVRHFSYRDPESPFFDPDDAFTAKYSAVRQKQAEAYIETASQSAVGATAYAKAAPSHSMCVGIATVQRDGARYFKDAVGSVLEGLTRMEREDMSLVNFIVNVDPNEHQAYNESWLELVSDKVLTYDDADEETKRKVKEADAPGQWRFEIKPLFDYVYLLQTCYDDGADWVVMLEDDTIGAEGWYMKVKEATQELERREAVDKMVYLRLFYNEGLLGWNSEEWLSYLLWSIWIDAMVLGALCLIRKFAPSSAPILTARTILVATFLLTPMSILLYFMAGRITTNPPATGISIMSNYGCCSQAFVFPRQRIPELVERYTTAHQGFVDVLTEIFANEKGYTRWALTPSVFQHVGSTSSKKTGPSKWGRNNAENIWNFHFEEFDAEVRREMHLGG